MPTTPVAPSGAEQMKADVVTALSALADTTVKRSGHPNLAADQVGDPSTWPDGTNRLVIVSPGPRAQSSELRRSKGTPKRLWEASFAIDIFVKDTNPDTLDTTLDAAEVDVLATINDIVQTQPFAGNNRTMPTFGSRPIVIPGNGSAAPYAGRRIEVQALVWE